MKRLLIGFFLIFFELGVDLFGFSIGLLPDFVGYFFLTKGMQELDDERPAFGKLRPFTIGMAILTGILYVVDLLGFSRDLEFYGFILGIITTFFSIYISYRVTVAVKDMEQRHNTDLNHKQLRTYWIMLAILNAVAYLFYWMSIIALICTLTALVASALYLIALNRTRQYHQYLPPITEDK